MRRDLALALLAAAAVVLTASELYASLRALHTSSRTASRRDLQDERWPAPRMSAGRLLMEGRDAPQPPSAAAALTTPQATPPPVPPQQPQSISVRPEVRIGNVSMVEIKVAPRMHRDQLVKHLESRNLDGSKALAQPLPSAAVADAGAAKDAVAVPDQYGAATAMAGPLPGAQDRCLQSHKAWPECPTPNGTVPLLVTGVGRSGTHHTQHSLMSKGFQLCHESVCADGAVSWTYAVVDPDRLYPWEWSRHRIHGRRFVKVVHQVRHPLRAIASLTTFEYFSWWWIAKHTPAVPDLLLMPPLRRALVHWVTWNRLIETYADHRFRMENTTVSDMCVAIGYDRQKCKTPVKTVRKAARSHEAVTWAELKAIDPHFARAAMEMAHRYGYDDVQPLLADGVRDDDLQ